MPIPFFVLFLSAFCSLSLEVSAQQKVPNPVQWSFEVKTLENGRYALEARAQITKGWSIYAQEFGSEDGPIPTHFQFEYDANKVDFLSKVEERGQRLEAYDELFEMNVAKFKESVVFVQNVEIKTKPVLIQGYVTYMCCNDDSCLPPIDQPFMFELK